MRIKVIYFVYSSDIHFLQLSVKVIYSQKVVALSCYVDSLNDTDYKPLILARWSKDKLDRYSVQKNLFLHSMSGSTGLKKIKIPGSAAALATVEARSASEGVKGVRSYIFTYPNNTN